MRHEIPKEMLGYFEDMERVSRGNPQDYPNQVDDRALGMAALSPAANTQSPSRGAMAGNQASQTLVVEGATQPLVITGIEDQYTEFTFCIKLEQDAKVLAVFFKDHSRTIKNSHVLLEYRGKDGSVEMGVLELKPYCSESPSMGFYYVFTGEEKKLYQGNKINAGTVFAHSPNVNYELGYPAWHNAVMLNVAMTTSPAGADDSVGICRDVLERYAFQTNRVIQIPWSHGLIALNTYGDEKNYRAFPSIGSKVRDDGILAAMRDITDTTLNPALLHQKSLRCPDPTFDLCYNAEPGSVVVDVVVDYNGKYSMAPNTDAMPSAYYKFRHAMLGDLYAFCMNFEKSIRSTHTPFKYSSKLHQLLKIAYAVVHRNDRQPGSPQAQVTNHIIHKRTKITDWMVTITLMRREIPAQAYKLTDGHGSKGVIGMRLYESHEMPVDKNGVRADIIMSTNSTISRANPGRLIEHYLGGVSDLIHRYLKKHVLEMCPNINFKDYKNVLRHVKTLPLTFVKALVDYDMKAHCLVNEKLEVIWKSGQYPTDHVGFLAARLRFGAVLQLPNGSQRHYKEIFDLIENSEYRPLFDRVSWQKNGVQKVSKMPIRIAPMDIRILSKLPKEFAATSSPSRNVNGIPAQLSKEAALMAPYRRQAGRVFGESENRNLLDAAPGAARELFDIANSPLVSSILARELLTAEYPTRVWQPIDREEVPYGRTKIYTGMLHMLQAWGCTIAYEDVH